MSIFGQVWVFSAIAFVLGAFLAWLFLVRPAQRRIRELERRLAAREATPMATRVAAPVPRVAAAPTEPDEPVAPMPSTRQFQAAEPEPAELTRQLSPVTDWPERDSLQGTPSRHAEPDAAEEEKDDFHLADQPWDLEPERQDVTSVLDPDDSMRSEPYGEATQHIEAQPEPAPERPETLRGPSLFEPVPYDADEEPDPEPRDAELPDDTPPVYAFSDPDAVPEPEEAIEQTQVLPKRQRRKPPLGGFEPPRPIQPSIRPVARRDPEPEGSGLSGSLFEPSVAPGGAPPARELTPSDGELPAGPFGPGSAMPLPGGGRPAEEFVVKASVTALRYCTEDSSQFPRMVAEVWFRTPADAERVGFRPLS
ncbi:hypothetical protein ABZ863_00945 [Saccharomonospora sp. NPDC046836]|uniref:sunset domain-containing protein n=1 Tax=Saccharomonospora sp. NPDC046836 TaxID=3156921 RepID=UPI0033D1363E